LLYLRYTEPAQKPIPAFTQAIIRVAPGGPADELGFDDQDGAHIAIECC
jgi:hypothetical protein